MLRLSKVHISVNDDCTVDESNGFKNYGGDSNYNLLSASYVLGLVIASSHNCII